ncbi:META domain-containing protein [Piscinibacter sp.]|uniref:META domain-containing protein n=1 Tax=Piscinibacter sp. TaxID=1903157 RepID=UPI0039E30482
MEKTPETRGALGRSLSILIAAAALAAAGCTMPPTPGDKPAAARPDGPAGKYWKLVELRGRPVPALAREPHLLLKVEDKRATGFGGCNGFGANLELDEGKARIRFEHIAATMMACPDGLETEQAFYEALRSADGYTLDGKRLTLHRAGGAPLARFELAQPR